MNGRQVHAELLDQVADSTHERDEVRRILTGLTEAELDARIAYAQHVDVPGCCGACQQGRMPCACPEACQVAKDGDALCIWRALLIAMACTAALAGGMFAMFSMFA